MDEVELHLAVKRLQKWPKEWRELIVRLPPDEARMIAELASLLDARPFNEEEKGKTE